MLKKCMQVILTLSLSFGTLSSAFANNSTASDSAEPGEILTASPVEDWWLGHYHYFGIGALGGLILSCAGLVSFCYGHSSYDRNHATLKNTCRSVGMGVFIGAGALAALLGLAWGGTLIYETVTN